MTTKAPDWIETKLYGLRKVQADGDELPERGTINFIGDAVSVVDNPTNKTVDVTVASTSTVVESTAWDPVEAVALVNVNLGAVIAAADGRTLSVGDRVGLVYQDDGSENGLYVKRSDGRLERADDADSPQLFLTGKTFSVKHGTKLKGATFELSTATPVTLDTDTLEFLLQQPEVDARRWAKADNSTDDMANLTAAHTAAPTVRYTAGTYRIKTSGTLGAAGSTLRAERGAKIRVTDGATLTVDVSEIKAAEDQFLFEVEAGSSLVWGSHAPREVQAPWFGAKRDGSDAAPAITRAFALNENGMRVRVPGQGYTLLTPIHVGAGGAGQNFEGMELVTDIAPRLGSTLATFLCGASFDYGWPMVLVQNCTRFKLEGVSFDADSKADYCLLVRSDSLLGSRECLLNEYDSCTFRNARIHDVHIGEPWLEPTVVGNTFTADGHPFANDDIVFFERRFDVDGIPGGFAVDAVYYVVQRSANTFKLSASLGGSAISSSTAGVGRWFVCRKDGNDCSQQRFEDCYLGGAGASATTIACYHQAGQETIGSGLSHCWGQGSMDLATVISSVSAGSDTITAASGTWTDGDAVMLFRDASTGAMPDGVSEDTIYFVRDSSGTTFKLDADADLSGSPVAIGPGAGTGTLKLVKVVPPYHFVTTHGGTVKIDCCATVAYLEDVLVSGGPRLTQGSRVTMIAHDSQSWRLVRASNRGRTLAPQEGGVHVGACVHADIFGGSRASVVWDQPLYGLLHVDGGVMSRDIYVLSSSAPVNVDGVEMFPYGGDLGFQATIRGTLTHVHGSWWESGTHVTRFVSLNVAGNSTIGSAGGSSSQIIHGGTTGLVNLKAQDGYFDFTTLTMRKLNATVLAAWTNPSGVALTLTGQGLVTVAGAGVTTDAGAGSWVAVANSSNCITISSANLTITAAGLSNGYLNFKSKSGQPLYLDTDGFHLRSSGAGEFGTIGVGDGSTDLAIAGTNKARFTSVSDTTIESNGNVGFKVEASGRFIFGSGTAPVTPTYTQNYTTAARTVNAYTTDAESSAYTGIDNAQVGTVYATVADLNALRVAYENLRASYDNLLQVVTASIDDDQARGLKA